MERIHELEKEISEIRYDLILKGATLNPLKQNLKSENISKIEDLDNEINVLRNRLSLLQTEISKLKHKYFVSYEVTFVNIWSNQPHKEIYNEVFYLNENIDVDFPTVTKNLLEKRLEELLLQLFALLKNKYDEVSLLIVKKI